MHELSVMSNILEIVLDYAGKYRVQRVSKINLEVGELSDLLPEWMQTYFDFVSKDTLADKAVLSIEKLPALLRCRSCSHEYGFTRDNWQFACPACDSADVEILQGREFRIVSIEVEDGARD
jgi:hydrogenase nickel incorporation protein HypA/HybF